MTSNQQTLQNGGGKWTCSLEVSLANLSLSPEEEKERRMTVTSSLRCSEPLMKSDPLGLLVRTLVASPRWFSPAATLRWQQKELYSERITTYTKSGKSTSSRQSAKALTRMDIPSSRLSFQLVVSVHRTKGTECGSSHTFDKILMTPTAQQWCEDPKSMRERAERKGYRNGTRYNSLTSQVVYSNIIPTPTSTDWKGSYRTEEALSVLDNPRQRLLRSMPMMQDKWGLLPTPLAQDIQHKSRIEALKDKGARDMMSRANGSARPNGLMDYLNFYGMLLTPSASDGMRAGFTMDALKNHHKPNADKSNLSEQIVHKIGGGSSQLNPQFVAEMMGYPTLWTVLPFLSTSGGKSQSRDMATHGCHK